MTTKADQLKPADFEVSKKEMDEYVEAMKPAAQKLKVTPEALLLYCKKRVTRFQEEGRPKIDVEAVMEVVNDVTDDNVQSIVNTGDGTDTH